MPSRWAWNRTGRWLAHDELARGPERLCGPWRGLCDRHGCKRSWSCPKSGGRKDDRLELSLTERAPAEFGVQCCGGEVTLLLEPVQPELTQIALFGMGHVGIALARILSRLPFELLLCDSRPEMLEASRLAELSSAANVRTFSFDHPSPEFVFAELRAGAFVFILTHDHREDIGILETALHRPDLAYVGLIGSSAKWSRFQVQLRARGFTDSDFARVTTPIGVAGVRGKHPEVIAVAAAAQILERVSLPESGA
jgi:xanthine dehydrogenase accessory factor